MELHEQLGVERLGACAMSTTAFAATTHRPSLLNPPRGEIAPRRARRRTDATAGSQPATAARARRHAAAGLRGEGGCCGERGGGEGASSSASSAAARAACLSASRHSWKASRPRPWIGSAASWRSSSCDDHSNRSNNNTCDGGDSGTRGACSLAFVSAVSSAECVRPSNSEKTGRWIRSKSAEKSPSST